MTKQATKILVSPSILSANFMQMAAEVASIEAAGAHMVHCDVMDGIFVPNISFGPKMVADLKKITALPLDVHLMIDRPERYIEKFAEAGADYITVHIEATENVRECLQKIAVCGKKAGISIKPQTPAACVEPFLDAVVMVLVMSVEPGFSGQEFMPAALEKIAEIRKMIGARDIILQIDGGVNEKNAAQIIAAGANALVAGNAFFKSPDRTKTVQIFCEK